MDRSSPLPRVAFVIDLGCDGATGGGDTSIRPLAQMFSRLQLPATWAVATAEQARFLFDRQLGLANSELALALPVKESQSAKRFRLAVGSGVAALGDVTGTHSSLVVGNVTRLCARASILAELGIGAILSSPSAVTGPAASAGPAASIASAAPRPIACGLWQLEPKVTLPSPPGLWRLLWARQSGARQFVAAAERTGTTLAVISAAQLQHKSGRSLRIIEKLLRNVSRVANHNQLALANISEVVAELASHRRSTPQRSILHRAA